ncbi:MAG: hypothetical protein O2954_06835 [bacterium]|nr:hypothetical protein [bacterium]
MKGTLTDLKNALQQDAPARMPKPGRLRMRPLRGEVRFRPAAVLEFVFDSIQE